MEVKEVIKKVSLVSLAMLCFTALSTYLFLFEDNKSDLNNGALIFVSYYGQLLLVLYNIVIIRGKNIIGKIELRKILIIELVSKAILFVIYNIILLNIDMEISPIVKFGVLLVVFIIDMYTLYKTYVGAGKYCDNEKRVEKFSDKEANFSLSGIFIYSLAIWGFNQGNEVTYLKIILFAASINLISENLKEYYGVKGMKDPIIILLIIGAAFNFIMLSLIGSYPNISIFNFIEAKDLVAAISFLFLVPYIRKTYKFK